MDDNAKIHEQEEEYHFSDEGIQTDAFSTAEPAKAKEKSSGGISSLRFGGLNKRNILIIVGVIVILIALYKLFGVFFESTSTSATKQQTTQQQPQPQPQPVQTQQQPAQPQTPPAAAQEYQQRLGGLQRSHQENANQINSINSQLSQLSNSMATLQNSLESITQQLQTMQNAMQLQADEIARLKERPATPKVRRKHYSKPVYHRPKVQRIPYFIQAMLPGRAWLIRPDGSTITVNEGTRLAGYGRITRIDPNQGLVKTSSGAIIRYRGM